MPTQTPPTEAMVGESSGVAAPSTISVSHSQYLDARQIRVDEQISRFSSAEQNDQYFRLGSREKRPNAESNIVDWDGPNDPTHPRNWTTRAKVGNTSLVIVLTFLTPLASSMFAPGVPEVLAEFHTSASTIAEIVVSVYILGFAFGPLIIGPLSEIYGRWPVYAVCNVFFLIFTIACAVASSIGQLIAFRFFAGCFGVCPLLLGAATIADLMPQDKRGAAGALFGMGPLLGPVIGPIAGAYLAAAKGWRWTFWVLSMAYGACTIAHGLFCHETYAVALLAKKTRRLQKQTGNMELRSAQDDGLPMKTRISRAMIRPLKMLVRSPIVSMMALYAAFVYGVLYLLYTTFTFVFQQYYGFSSGNVGLTYLGPGIGMLIGSTLITLMSDRLVKGAAAKNDGELKPEYRLLPLMYTGWLTPVGLFIYGWTLQYHEHWAIPLFGTVVFGVGMVCALITIIQYLIDSYATYAASAIAANVVLRSIVGGVLPLAGLTMYNNLGIGWGNSLVGFIALALTPVPFLFYIWGERIRKRAPITM